MSASRIEHDSLGSQQVPQDRLWGAQTQRALAHFRIADETMPLQVIHALAGLKAACARVNRDLGRLDRARAEAIAAAAAEVSAGRHDAEFPLSLWQSGSGTQSHMNLNEVLANRASELLGGGRGEARVVHPNDHVNLGQSSNDLFPSAMHIAASLGLARQVLPALNALHDALEAKSTAFAGIVKIGRTHLQDATPLTLGQEFSGYVAQLEHARAAIVATQPGLLQLAVGGTAVGTGLNTPTGFGECVAADLAQCYGLPFRSAANKFAALAGHEALLAAHGALKTLAAALMKIANDLRWLASGPRCGLGELRLPANEPGSSIMPGKVNPTQCEALGMLCCQVFGNDVAVSLGGAAGNFELNVYKPLIISNFLHSARLLADGMKSFDTYCVAGIEAQRPQIDALLRRSLMLVTALAPHIGHDRAAAIAQRAHREGISLRQAALDSGEVTAAAFDQWVRPEAMTQPQDS
jgi:fumarate hydratase class II